MKIYHITTRPAWLEATRSGVYAAPSLASEGFIHCSTEAQILPVARQFFAGHNDLVLLVVDADRLTAELKWEASVPPAGLGGGISFPHVYGQIPLNAVLHVLDFGPDARGEFHLPPLPLGDRAAPKG